MDYGQTSQTDVNSHDFFTAGAGTSNELLNNVRPEDNLDLSNNTTSWNATTSRFQNRNFGQNAMMGGAMQNPNDSRNIAGASNSESIPPFGPQTLESLPGDAGPDFGMTAPNYGQIVNLEPAPSTTQSEQTESIFDYDRSAIRVEGNNLNPKAAEIFSKNEKNLAKTGDAASFVDSFEQAKIDNLDNSYNRKFGG